jgi:uncharacterized protein YjbI with pentapeptide repeats
VWDAVFSVVKAQPVPVSLSVVLLFVVMILIFGWIGLLWALLLLIGILIIVGVYYRVPWMGFGPHPTKRTRTMELDKDANEWKETQIAVEEQTPRTFWDWLGIVTLSAVLAIVALTYNSKQQSLQQKFQKHLAHEQQQQAQDASLRQEQQAQDANLRAYLDEMSTLMIDEDLQTSGERDPVRNLARARTLVALLDVGPDRQRDIVRFLYESRLIKRSNPIVDLRQANLTDAHLEKMPLSKIDLSGANLSDGADDNAKGAFLTKANFQKADLQDANLQGANLQGVSLQGANLSDGADRNERGALLKKADLQDANLKDTKLGASILQGAIMPNGQKYKEWLKNKEGRG